MFFASITVFVGIIVMGLVYSRGGMSLLKTEWKA
jgi:hypothetical protein